jgi:hypothetical protein
MGGSGSKDINEQDRLRIFRMIIAVEEATTLKQFEEVIARHAKETAEKPLFDEELIEKYDQAVKKTREKLKNNATVVGNEVPQLKL